MQSISLSAASRNLGCSHPRFSSSSSFVIFGKKLIASKNGPSCSTMRWILTLPISIAVDKMTLPLEHDPEKCEAVFRKDHAQTNNLKRDDDSSQSHRALATGGRHVGMFQPARQIGFAGVRFQHDRSARQRIDAIGERERLLDQLLDQQHRG